MSANDLAFFQPLLNMNTEQALRYLGNKLYMRIDTSRGEVHTTTYFSVRGTSGGYTTNWYDIQIIFPIGATITLTPARLGNGTY